MDYDYDVSVDRVIGDIAYTASILYEQRKISTQCDNTNFIMMFSGYKSTWTVIHVQYRIFLHIFNAYLTFKYKIKPLWLI